MVEQPRLPLIPPGSYAVQYRAFQEAEEALNECEVMRKVFPLLAGSSTSFSSSGSHSFRNLENLINGTIVDVKPDIYDRADPNQIDQGILAELDLFIRVENRSGTKLFRRIQGSKVRQRRSWASSLLCRRNRCTSDSQTALICVRKPEDSIGQ